MTTFYQNEPQKQKMSKCEEGEAEVAAAAAGVDLTDHTSHHHLHHRLLRSTRKRRRRRKHLMKMRRQVDRQTKLYSHSKLSLQLQKWQLPRSLLRLRAWA